MKDAQLLNRLQFARSPYLLQHADNPVEWYEWGDAAFDKARNENLPVMVSIGYATCHWCHVMAHESFADEEVADLLNRHYVCIKVDREERPDIDDFYMTVSQLLTGSGGWPLNIFMTPDRRPFMAITYLPKRGHAGMSGFMELLANIATLWQQRPDLIEKNCRGILEALGNISRQTAQKSMELEELTVKVLEQLAGIYDWELGGFGNAPKFPMAIYLSWLIEQGRNNNRHALEMALQTLRRIRSGGIWDQLGGGLHRYAVDRKWLVPHFEKMLYDQAQVALAALDAFQAGRDEYFLRMAEEIFAFVDRELTSAEGAFCSALDADTEGVEGKFYVWSREEVEQCLGPDAGVFCRYYDITAAGNFEDQNIPNIPADMKEFCAAEGLDSVQTGRLLERCRQLLFERREARVHPFRDDKIVIAWNGLMIAALARGGAESGKREYTQRAARAATFILENMRRRDGRLLRSYRGGPSDIPAFLEDYACLAFGLLELFEATLEKTWLDEALRLTEEALQLFRDPESGKFVTIGHDAEQMPVRVSSDHDGVTPSAVSMATQVLARLAGSCDRPDLADFAHQALAGCLGPTELQPLNHLGVLRALDMLETEPFIITFSGAMEEKELFSLLAAVRRHYIPGRVLRRACDPAEPPGVQVCAAGTCHPAIRGAAELEAFLMSAAAG